VPMTDSESSPSSGPIDHDGEPLPIKMLADRLLVALTPRANAAPPAASHSRNRRARQALELGRGSGVGPQRAQREGWRSGAVQPGGRLEVEVRGETFIILEALTCPWSPRLLAKAPGSICEYRSTSV
jgi:hypothetical protein